MDWLLLHAVATATIRTSLACVTSALEGTCEAAGETVASSWWELGPEPAPD